MAELPNLSDFSHQTREKLRYADTDRQGHVNNAVFASLLEAGRVEMLYDPAGPLHAPGSSFVIARVSIDFLGEIHWPGFVDVASRVAAIGRSSIRLEQALFQDNRPVATSESVIVHVNGQSRRSDPLPAETVEALSRFRPPADSADS